MKQIIFKKALKKGPSLVRETSDYYLHPSNAKETAESKDPKIILIV